MNKFVEVLSETQLKNIITKCKFLNRSGNYFICALILDENHLIISVEKYSKYFITRYRATIKDKSSDITIFISNAKELYYCLLGEYETREILRKQEEYNSGRAEVLKILNKVENERENCNHRT